MTDRRRADGRTTDHGHPISSPCEPKGSGELKIHLSCSLLYQVGQVGHAISTGLVLEKSLICFPIVRIWEPMPPGVGSF